jgi:hypothetical protein
MNGTAYIVHEEHHRALVKRLSSEVTPTRPLWPVGGRLALWMMLEVGVLAWVIRGSPETDFGSRYGSRETQS